MTLSISKSFLTRQLIISLMMFSCVFASPGIIPQKEIPEFRKPLKIQDFSHALVLTLSFKIGPHFAFFSNFPFGISYLTEHRYEIDYNNMKLVFNPELTMILQVSKWFSVESGLAFLNHGSEISDIVETHVDSGSAKFIYKFYSSKRSFYYFAIPIYLKAHYPLKYHRLYGNIGITSGFLLTSGEIRKYESGENENIDWTEFTEPIDYSLIASGGIEFSYKKPFSYLFEIMFSKGLNHFGEKIPPNPYVQKSEVREADVRKDDSHYILGITIGANYNFAWKRFRELYKEER